MADTAKLKTQVVRLAELHEAAVNPRLHEDRNLDAIRRSLQRFGQVEPLLVRKANKEVIGGNGRLRVMRELGWKTVEVVLLDVDEPTARALGVALNRSGELAEWDFQMLSDLMRELQGQEIDLTDLGWADYEIEPLLQAEWQPPAIDPDADTGGTAKPFKVVEFTEEQWQVVAAAIVEICRGYQAGISS